MYNHGLLDGDPHDRSSGYHRPSAEGLIMADGRHPYFLDRHAVYWHTRLADALAAATAAGKKVFVLHGRKRCEGSRALVEKTIVKAEVNELLNEHFACMAADADAADPDVEALLPSLPKREPTPVCLYLDAAGRVLHSTAGGRPAAVLMRDMLEAVAKKE
jgi:hypothetical protein